MATPSAGRPYIAHREYGLPEDTNGLLKWPEIAQRFESEQNFWICTTSSAGKPHVRPTWGVFVDDTIYFGGGPKTRWSRNLADNPHVSVHLESGARVVIAEGTVDRISDAGDPRLAAADDAYEQKYNMRHGPPMWVLRPDVVLAWSNFPKDCTRFTF
jgi:Pyridoxamine 5'-phosphate oxidase